MSGAPQSPSDSRDEPHFIDNECECGATLVQWDDHYDTDREPWYDEWVCPNCEDGVHMDWPESHWEELTERADSDEWTTLEEVREELGLDK